MSLQGPVRVEPVIAQGCRPLTDTIWTIGKCENNIVLEVSPCYLSAFVTTVLTGTACA